MVEDEAAILRLGRAMLMGLGYTVLTAATPGEAIRLAQTGATKIDLLITDVVMPEMNGRELAERLAALKPGSKSLFMSGYTADVIAHRGILHEGVQFIQKPFTRLALAVKVREVLDS
jgi:CheY-like chemotaxis protein